MKKNKCDSVCKKTSIGGQALIEGIMMRGPQYSAMAVRNPEGEMVLEKWENKKPKNPRIVKIPIVRGVVNFISSMAMGYKCLMRSAEISGLDELEDEMKREKEEKKAKKAAKKAKKSGGEIAVPQEEVVSVEDDAQAPVEHTETGVKNKEKKESGFLINTVMIVASVLAMVLCVGLFIMLPTFIYRWLCEPYFKPSNPALASLVKSVFEGVLKIIMLVAYMALVSLMKDIKRTFQYHGAEHKTIFCYEHGKELTVENVRGERRFHPRCGTSFLILMLLVGIFISFFIDPLSILICGAPPSALIRTAIRLLLVPVIMGVGYELIKLAGKYDNLFTRIISAPGMWLQHITVLEPSDDMIECAIKAFVEVIPENNTENKTEDEPQKTE